MTSSGNVGTEIAPEVDPHGIGLQGMRLEPDEVVRLTQDEVEDHPAFGTGATLDALRAARRPA